MALKLRGDTIIDECGKTLLELTEQIENIEKYQLPKASSSTLGAIKVGANLTIDEDGTLNAVGGGISKEQLLDMVYPVGSLYMSMNQTDPSELFGGSWERIKDRFIYANGDATTAGTLGGSATHNHGLSAGFTALNVGSGGIQYLEKQVSAWGTNAAMNIASSYNSYQTKSWGIALGGATDNTNTMPPYITAYIWKRIA